MKRPRTNKGKAMLVEIMAKDLKAHFIAFDKLEMLLWLKSRYKFSTMVLRINAFYKATGYR